jgi:hypothetical protein
VWTTEDRAVAAGLSVDPDRWRQEFDELMLRVGGRFARVERRRRMVGFVRGLLAGLPRVNCWSIAEHAGVVLQVAVRDIGQPTDIGQHRASRSSPAGHPGRRRANRPGSRSRY